MLTVKELEKLSRRQLRARADEVFQDAETRGPGYLIGAQFYIGELERRADSRTSIRDLILEILVICLIGGELYMSHQQSVQQDTQFKEQQIVLGNMEKSSRETLAAITAERRTMAAMNDALQKQLSLYYDVELNAIYNEQTKQLRIVNQGRTAVKLWGGKLGVDQNTKITMYPKPKLVAPGNGTYDVSLSDLGLIVSFGLAKDQHLNSGFVFLVTNEKNERFTFRGDLIGVWQNNSFTFLTQPNTVLPGWDKK